MNSFIENMNQLGGYFLDFAWPMFWQSSLLIVLVFAVDLLLARKIRASVRHALWLVVLVKLLLPPTLALPTGAAWWLFPVQPVAKTTVPRTLVVTYDDAAPLPAFVPATVPLVEPPPPPKLDRAGWTLLATGTASAGLLLWLLFRWGQVVRMVSRAKLSGGFSGPIDEARRLAGLRGPVRVRIAEDRMSPAVCGLFRPVILLPRTLADQLSAEQLRAVLLHEAIHIRRWDIWVNCAQALLQVAYWWQPLVWVANARIRRVREEAVDDAVMLALDAEAEIYAPTLLEVARLALRRPLLSLGLVGILESRSALRQRIERLLAFRAPRRAGLTLASLCGIFVFSAVALPMGEAPARVERDMATDTEMRSADIPSTTSAQCTNPPAVLVVAEIYEMQADDLKKFVTDLHFNPGQAGGEGWWSASPEEYSKLSNDLKKSGQIPLLRPRILTSSGKPADFFVGNGTNSTELDCLPAVEDGRVNLAIQGELIDQSAATAATNRFKMNALMPNHGGMVMCLRDGASNAVVCLSVATLTNGPTGALVKPSEPLVWSLSADHPASGPAARSQPWPMPARQTPPAEAALNPPVYTGPGRQAIMAKLGNIHLGSISYDSLPLSEVLRQLSAQCKLLDPEHKGVNFLLNDNPNLSSQPAAASTTLDVGSVIIKIPSLTDVRVSDVLDAVVLTADHPIKYSIQDFAVIFSARDAATPPLAMRTFWVDPNTFDSGLDQVGAKNFGAVQNRGSTGGGGSGAQNQNNGAVVGVVNAFGAGGGSPNSSQNAGGSGRLDQAAPAAKSVQPGLQDQSPSASADHLVQAGKVFYEMGKYDQAKEKFNAVLALNQDDARANYYLRLISDEEVRMSRKEVQNVPGRKQIITQIDRIHLPLVSFNDLNLKEVARQLSELAKQNDPEKVGVRISTATNSVSSQWDEIDSVIVKLPSLTDVRLADVLDAIVLVADKPIKYSIQDDGVVVSARGSEKPQLFIRTFRVDTNVLYSAVENARAQAGQTASAADTRSSVLATARIFFHQLGVDWNSPPGKQVYFNDQKGYLFVKATESDLDQMERALQILNEAPPLVDPAPPQVHIKARFYEVPNGTLKDLGKYLNATNPVDRKPMGILTSQSETAVRHELRSCQNIEVLGEPEITMLSGRQAQMRITELVTVITNLVSGITPQTETFEAGPVLDLIPYVLADGYTINLAAIPTMTDFLGYEVATNISDRQIGTIPRPKFRDTRIIASANLWDNQTLLLSGRSERAFEAPNGLPPTVQDKELLVFITATIIDPAGNRVHSDDELPFAQDGTPSQPQGQVNIPSSLLKPPSHIMTFQGGQTQMKASTLKTYIGDFPPYHNGDPIHKGLEEPGAGAWP